MGRTMGDGEFLLLFLSAVVVVDIGHSLLRISPDFSRWGTGAGRDDPGVGSTWLHSFDP